MLLALVMLLWSQTNNEAHLRGVQLFQQHKYSEAVAVLQEAVQHEKPQSEAYRESAMLIGQSYFMLSQAPKAIPWLEKIPATNESSYMLGYAYYQAGNEEQAVASFARLFGLNPKSAAAHLLTGQMLVKRQLEDAGVEEVKKALAMNPNLPEAHYILAEILMFRGRVSESVRELEQELSINPNFSMAWYRLGDAYVRLENWDSAIADLQRAIWLNQTFSGPYILLGKCYYKKRDFANAERFLRQALDIDPKNYMAAYLLGQTLIAAGKTEEGKSVLKKSTTLRERQTQ